MEATQQSSGKRHRSNTDGPDPTPKEKKKSKQGRLKIIKNNAHLIYAQIKLQKVSMRLNEGLPDPTVDKVGKWHSWRRSATL
jgi:hypothetical protein